MHKLMLALAVLAATVSASAENLYYNPQSSADATNTHGRLVYVAANWLNEAGVATRPKAGDVLVVDKGTQMSANPDNQKVTIEGLWYRKAFATCSQGTFVLRGGSMGVTNSCGGTANWYTSVSFTGNGDIPFYLPDGATLGCQRVFYQIDPPNHATLVKCGGGVLAFQDDSAWGSKDPTTVSKMRIEAGTLKWNVAGEGGKKYDLQLIAPGTELTFADDGRSTSGAVLSIGKRDLAMKDVTWIEASPKANPTHVVTSDNTTNVNIRFIGQPGRNPMVFGGSFTKTAGILWNPISSDCVFVLSNSVSTTTGDLIISNGTVRVSNGAMFTSLSNLDIATETAKLVVDNFCIVAARNVFVRGEAIPAGAYKAVDCDWVDGAGYVLVGGATLPLADDNWWRSADGAPTVIENGVSTNYTGVAFSGGSQTLTAGRLSSVVLGDGGVATVGDGATYSYGWPTYLAKSQVWSIASGDTVEVTDDFRILGGVSWWKSGAGDLKFVGKRAFVGNMDVTNGTVIAVGDEALGGAGKTVFHITDSSVKGKLRLVPEPGKNEITISRDLEFHYWVTGEHGSFLFLPENATVNFRGQMKTSSSPLKPGLNPWPCHWNYSCPASTTVHWYGGMHAALNHVFPGGYHYVHAALTGGDRFNVSAKTTVELLAPGNAIGAATGNFGGTLLTRVAYALDASGLGKDQLITFSGGTIDLCGNDQGLSLLDCISDNNSKIHSDSPAFMRLVRNQTAVNGSALPNNARTNYLHWTGAAGLSMERTSSGNPFVLMAKSETVGTLQVTAGLLVMNAKGSWPNAANVVVKGGELRIDPRTVSQGPAFGRQVNFQLSSAGKLNLAENLRVKCATLTLDGEPMMAGTYGSSDSSADNKDDAHFLGKGVLRVGDIGTMIILR